MERRTEVSFGTVSWTRRSLVGEKKPISQRSSATGNVPVYQYKPKFEKLEEQKNQNNIQEEEYKTNSEELEEEMLFYEISKLSVIERQK